MPTRPAIKYLVEQRDMEIWLAPIGTTRVLVPFRVSIPTPIGQGVMAGDAVRHLAAARHRIDRPEDAVALARGRARPLIHRLIHSAGPVRFGA